MIDLDDIRAAAKRLQGQVRRTPLIAATQLKSPPTEATLTLKLELLQVVALEVLEQDVEVDTLLVAIGGGGLISGIATAVRALKPSVRVIGVEAAGSPTLQRSLEAGRSVGLEAVTTSVATMACGRTDDRIFDIVRRTVDEIVLVDDEEMFAAARWLWFEMGLAADLSGAAALAALQTGRVRLAAGSRACTVVCGAGPEALSAPPAQA